MRDRARILVVEGHPATRENLRVALNAGGLDVVDAPDAATAIDEATREAPALVLQDLVLPDMGGLELVGRLRTIPGMEEVPILGLSGFLSRLDEARTAQAGFTGLLVKPVEPSWLIETIRGFLPRGTPQAPAEAARGALLIVDDDPVQRKLARIHYESAGYAVETAGDGAEALAAARARPPDVVLSDVLMPEMDGYELCLELRRDTRLGHVPVVLLSSQYGSSEDRALAERVGAHALVLRTPGLQEADAALDAALVTEAPPPGEAPDDPTRLAHARAVIRRLERQVEIGSGLLRRTLFQAAQLSLLGGMAEALARREDTDRALEDVLAATLGAVGISKGAIYLKESEGPLRLRHAIGFPDDALVEVDGFFGQRSMLEEIVAAGRAVAVPSGEVPRRIAGAILAAADVATAQVVPLVSHGRGIGAIVLGARRTDVTSEDAVAFARAVGAQIVQSLELADAFARLATSEARYRSFIDHANDAVAVMSTDGILREVNRRMEEILGLPRDRIEGRHIREFAFRGAEGENVEQFEALVREGSSRTLPIEIRRRDGERVLIEFSTSTLRVADEALVIALGRDVTEQVRSRAQLMVADRMVSVGTLAAGVAHEINNPLMAVTGNLEMVKATLDDLAEMPGAAPELDRIQVGVRDAREAAIQVQAIVRDLKVFSRPDEDTQGPVDIHRVLDGSLRMARNEIRHRARVTKSYGEIPHVIGNESRLGQVFLNLLINAAQSITEGAVDANEIAVRTRCSNSGERVVVEVADTGSGIESGALSKIFDPFYTTKEVGVGTGLGLSICHRIVADHGGSTEVESEPGRGSVFRVILVATLERPASASAPAVSAGPSRRILVIDDERVVATAIARMLELNHAVEVAPGGTEALARIDAGERYDVILCDLMMPRLTGMDLHAEILRRAPEQAAQMVFMTGGAFTSRSRDFLREQPNPRLEKPFDWTTLLAAVNSV